MFPLMFIIFSLKNRGIPVRSLNIGNKTISMANSYKILGTEIDNHLNYQSQYKSIMRKLSTKKITFAKISYLLTTGAAISVGPI